MNTEEARKMTNDMTKDIMSRDIRGDPYIPYNCPSPWGCSSTIPIRNRQMIIG